MTDSRFLDSSAWLSYFYAENQEIRTIVESNILILTSVLSIFEIKKKFVNDKVNPIKLDKTIKVIKSRSLLLDVNLEITEKAVDFAMKNNLLIIDALIYASALVSNSKLITLDNDFRNLNEVIILKKD